MHPGGGVSPPKLSQSKEAGGLFFHREENEGGGSEGKGRGQASPSCRRALRALTTLSECRRCHFLSKAQYFTVTPHVADDPAGAGSFPRARGGPSGSRVGPAKPASLSFPRHSGRALARLQQGLSPEPLKDLLASITATGLTGQREAPSVPPSRPPSLGGRPTALAALLPSRLPSLLESWSGAEEGNPTEPDPGPCEQLRARPGEPELWVYIESGF